MSSKSYWSYGKVNHKDGALIHEGRVLIDTAKSFVYTEADEHHGIQRNRREPNYSIIRENYLYH